MSETVDPKPAWELLEQLVKASSFHNNEYEVRDWLEALVRGRGGAAWVFFSRLTQLNKIQLDMEKRNPMTPYVARTISKLAARSHSGYLDQGLSALEDVRPEFKDRLERGTFAEIPRLMAAFSRLPNLRNMSIMGYYASNQDGDSWLPSAETLPKSIREVTILAHRCPPGANRLDFESVFRGFRPQSYPNLCSISAYHRNMKDFHKIGHNGADHILKIHNHALSEAGISTDDITHYKLRNEYFEKKRKQYRKPPGQRGGDRWMDEFGFKDNVLYALPAKDTEGR
ncbi:GPI anchored protein, putative [Talaromyces stipitatus ATCC 10500]|uniref:GPI anchored protein, putative n=1 Tax=Talaromyces stipitatus (strain ATCC 10500 / CBS 375.48 / QM 6759 / NRRL 1006) TaxID=441959 RepID=B8ML16_TALSN|nr:GPI anchored protein, putative [Talaromyces stipitatus ATCC 10500]EED15432.1 GPI anchored protein, putative [Talaromyces stipitatus ATCC 10500]